MAKNRKPNMKLQGKRSFEKENPDSYFQKNPVWSFKWIDKDHPRWSLKVQNNLYENVILKLKDYEGLTWAEINKASGGRTYGTNSHYEDVEDLCKDARDRINELMIFEDRVFSLRLDGETRLYGIIENGVFYVIWYDPNHEIYPVKK